jgi:hypothetical protein
VVDQWHLTSVVERDKSTPRPQQLLVVRAQLAGCVRATSQRLRLASGRMFGSEVTLLKYIR